KSLDEEAFNAKSNDIAANISSSSGQESASIGLRSLSKSNNLKQAVMLVNEALTQPRFDAAVFERIKKQAITALQQQESTPDFIADRALTRLMYPQHPYGRSANVSVESIRSVSLDDIRAFYRSHYGQNNAIVAIVGDVNRNQAQQMVQGMLQNLPKQVSLEKSVPTVPRVAAQHKNIPFAGEQAQVLLGTPLIKRHDSDYYPLIVGNYILGGGGFDSRLMKELRDRHGYTYGVYSSLEPSTEAGPFGVSFSTQKKNTRLALMATRVVIEQFVAKGPTEEELKQAKANIMGSFPLRFDSNGKLVNYLSLIGTHQLPSDYLEVYPKAIAAVTTEQVKEVWQRRVHFPDLNSVVVGAQ
ncbi:MAG: M16 family metallopeptidase, partial [Shewanella sp.]